MRSTDSGVIQVQFALNEGQDYRFEVYRSYQGQAFAGSLATQYGVGAPPTLEWWFFDNKALNPQYVNDVTWPNMVYIRVFRVQNDMTCNSYQLEIFRDID